MKDTAVKFLIDEISCRFVISEELRIAMYKAIEMEKEQIIESYRDGRSDQQSDRQSRFYNRMAEQYYKETFKQQEQ
jgi:hypothetical protein